MSIFMAPVREIVLHATETAESVSWSLEGAGPSIRLKSLTGSQMARLQAVMARLRGGDGMADLYAFAGEVLVGTNADEVSPTALLTVMLALVEHSVPGEDDLGK